jgi:hypothetical protein
MRDEVARDEVARVNDQFPDASVEVAVTYVVVVVLIAMLIVVDAVYGVIPSSE